MNPKAKKFAALFALPAIVLGMAVLRVRAQAGGAPATGSAGQANSSAGSRAVVVLDPAHGGPDNGATLGERLLEKDVALAIAARVKAALTSAGFTVVMTRDADSLAVLPSDQRAETANRARAMTCLVIHATGAGNGVHLYSSTLEPKDAPNVDAGAGDEGHPVFEPTPWETAQAEFVGKSLRLQGELSAALGKAGLPVVVGREPVRPLDNMTCPAIAVEVAPLAVAGEDATPVTDPGYQQRLASTLALALQGWRTEMAVPARSTAAAGAASGNSTAGGKP